jgi:hypothetical protein
MSEKIMFGALAAFIMTVVGTLGYLDWRVDILKNENAALTARAEGMESLARSRLEALERRAAAAEERAGRTAAAQIEREALINALDETCDYDSDYSLPDALYERLCRPVPGAVGDPGGPQPGVFRPDGQAPPAP